MIRERTNITRFLAHYTVALLCVFSITVTPVTVIASTSRADETRATPSLIINMTALKTDWRQAAQEYNSAMGLISQVAGTSLKTKEDVAKSLELLRRAAPGIRRGVVSAIIQTAANDGTFRNAVQGSLERRCGNLREVKQLVACVTGLVNEAAKNRSAFDEAGGSSAVRAVQSRLKGDAEILKKTSANLQNAIKTLRPQSKNLLNPDKGLNVAIQTQHAKVRRDKNPPLQFDSLRVDLAVPETVSPQGAEIFLYFYLLGPVCSVTSIPTFGLSFGPCIATGISLGLAVIVVDWLLKKGDDFFGRRPVITTNPDTGRVDIEEKTDFRFCQEYADGLKKDCLSSAGDDPWKQAGCWAEWSLKTAACLVVPI